MSGPPDLTARIPKAVNRELRSYAYQIEEHRRGLTALRSRLVEDIEESEAVGRALKQQLSEVDRTLRTGGNHD